MTMGTARSLLLTVLGEFVLPAGKPVWTSAFLPALALVGVEEKATRQALARTATAGWITSRRDGRRTAWRLTEAGRRMLTEGAERIYGFGGPARAWAGEWLVVLASVPETNRRLRHILRTRLTWSGLGNLMPGVWVGPHPEREDEVRHVLAETGVNGSATIFTGRLGDVDEARRIAGRAWDLDEVERAYEHFIEEVRAMDPADPAAMLGAQIRLVHAWRRFPLVDPALPPELLPHGWRGADAATLFRERHAAWKPSADVHWKELTRR